MVWLPVVERELRVAARKHATYRIRVLALLAVAVALAWGIFVASKRSGSSGAADGRELFIDLAWPAAIFSILIGVFATSDSVGVEKREGTLGLLFLTDLKGHDVIFGKLVASSLNGFYALIAVLPVLGVPLLVGGVTFSEFLRLTAALVTAIVFSLSAGIFFSTFEQSERKSMFLTSAFLVSITVFPLIFGDMTGYFSMLLSPAYTVMITVYNASVIVPAPPVFWVALSTIWLMTVLLLSRASLRVPKSWQEKFVHAVKPPAIRPLNERPKRQLLDGNPFAWLAARGEGDPRLVWLFLGCMLALWLFLVLIKPVGLTLRDMLDENVVQASDLVLGTVFKVWIVSEACRRFAEDRRSGAFELLLSTPLTVKQIVDGQWLALRKQFSVPIVAVLLWGVFLGIGYQGEHDGPGIGEHWAAMVFLLADATALGLAGMWLGLLTQSRNRAILTGLIIVVTIPWLASAGLNRYANWSGKAGIAAECVVWGLADFFVLVWAARIYWQFRHIATELSAGSVKA